MKAEARVRRDFCQIRAALGRSAEEIIDLPHRDNNRNADVKPMMTGIGMKLMSRPSLKIPPKQQCARRKAREKHTLQAVRRHNAPKTALIAPVGRKSGTKRRRVLQ